MSCHSHLQHLHTLFPLRKASPAPTHSYIPSGSPEQSTQIDRLWCLLHLHLQSHAGLAHTLHFPRLSCNSKNNWGDQALVQQLRWRLGHLQSISECLGSSLASTSDSDFLLMCTMNGSKVKFLVTCNIGDPDWVWAPNYFRHLENKPVGGRSLFVPVSLPF